MSEWTEPKQNKLARMKESRLKRGPNHKAYRHKKGRKARLDELNSLKARLEKYAEWIVQDRENRRKHPEWYRPGTIQFGYGAWFDETKKKLNEKLAAAILDEFLTIEETKPYQIKKP